MQTKRITPRVFPILTPSTWYIIFIFYAKLVRTYCRMAQASFLVPVCLSVDPSTNLVNTIKTEPFRLGPSNLVHKLLMIRGPQLLICKVRGQRSRSHARHCCKTLLTRYRLNRFSLDRQTLYTYFLIQDDHTYLFSRSGCKGQGHMLNIVVKPCKHDTDWTASARTVKRGTHTSFNKRTTPIDFQGQGSKVKVTCLTLFVVDCQF